MPTYLSNSLYICVGAIKKTNMAVSQTSKTPVDQSQHPLFSVVNKTTINKV